MSLIPMLYILTPTVGWAVPLLWPVVLAAAGALGYTQLTSDEETAPLRGELSQKLAHQHIVTLELDQIVKDLVSDEIGREDLLRFVKDDIMVVFKRDVRGKFKVEVMGPDTMSTRQLEAMGMEFAGTVLQQFAFNKVAQEMERRGANVVSEEVNEEEDIVIKLRRWE